MAYMDDPDMESDTYQWVSDKRWQELRTQWEKIHTVPTEAEISYAFDMCVQNNGYFRGYLIWLERCWPNSIMYSQMRAHCLQTKALAEFHAKAKLGLIKYKWSKTMGNRSRRGTRG